MQRTLIELSIYPLHLVKVYNMTLVLWHLTILLGHSTPCIDSWFDTR